MTGTSLEATTLTTACDVLSMIATLASSLLFSTAPEVAGGEINLSRTAAGRLKTKGAPESPVINKGPKIPIVKIVPMIDTIKLKTTVNKTTWRVVGWFSIFYILNGLNFFHFFNSSFQ